MSKRFNEWQRRISNRKRIEKGSRRSSSIATILRVQVASLACLRFLRAIRASLFLHKTSQSHVQVCELVYMEEAEKSACERTIGDNYLHYTDRCGLPAISSNSKSNT